MIATLSVAMPVGREHCRNGGKQYKISIIYGFNLKGRSVILKLILLDTSSHRI